MIKDNVDTPVENTATPTPKAKSTPEAIPGGFKNVRGYIDDIFDALVKKMRLAIDSETAKKLKKKTKDAYDLALEIGKDLGDVNNDGKVNADDLQAVVDKVVAKLEGLGKIDPDLKTALLAGVVASAAMFLIPIVGQTLAIPAFASAAAFFYLKAKLENMKK